jgi:hypothetical protein
MGIGGVQRLADVLRNNKVNIIPFPFRIEIYLSHRHLPHLIYINLVLEMMEPNIWLMLYKATR